MPSSDWLKAYDSSKEKNMPNSVGASTHPYFTSLLIGKGSEAEPSYRMMPFGPSWKDLISRRSLGGTSNPLQKDEEAFSADKVKSLCQIDEGNV